MKSGRFVLFTLLAMAAAVALLTKFGNIIPQNNTISRIAEAQEPTNPGPIGPGSTDLQDKGELSANEIALLQDLSARRQELDAREAGFETRERLLAEVEQRIDDKIQKLAQLQGEILVLVEVQEEKDNEKFDSLVRVYERMRPRDAARIIEGLDISLQLEVANRMREIKMAAILSVMDPAAARELTNRLASRAQLPQTDG
jgi:flagellar motility protein MotE (MotC chaperone)